MMQEMSSPQVSSSGKEGWRRMLWKQRMPPGYQPRSRTPPPDPSTLIPGELWGASRDEIEEWKKKSLSTNLGLTWGITTTTTTTTATTSVVEEAMEIPNQEEQDRVVPLVSQQRKDEKDTTALFQEEPINETYSNQIRHGINQSELSHEMDHMPRKPSMGRFLGAPLVPTSISESPKSALNALYGKEMTKTPITDASYFCWDNHGPSHSRGYTCVLVCPATYEIFPAGRYISTATTAANAPMGMWVNDHTGIVWYSRKKEATQGAAAFRYDCWYYRAWLQTNPQAPKCKLFGKDDPYASPDDDRPQRVIAEIPLHIMESIQVQICKWKEQAEQRALEDEREAMVEIEEVAYRNAYIENRGEHALGVEMIQDEEDSQDSGGDIVLQVE